MNADNFRKASRADYLWIQVRERRVYGMGPWARDYLTGVDKLSTFQEAPWQIRDIPKTPKTLWRSIYRNKSIDQ